MIKVSVNRQSAVCYKSATEYITTGQVGQEIIFEFSEAWDGFSKTAVFKGSGVKKDALLVSDRCEIPHECLAVPGDVLTVGVYGVKGDKVTPTIYCIIDRIKAGADPSGEESEGATPELWQQAIDAATQANEKAQELLDMAARGEFDGEPGKPGETGPQGEPGIPGVQGPPGDPGIYYGTTTPPTDGSVKAWINPDGGAANVFIMKAVFTDRPSLWEWLEKNYSKSIMANVVFGQDAIKGNIYRNVDNGAICYSIYTEHVALPDSYDGPNIIQYMVFNISDSDTTKVNNPCVSISEDAVKGDIGGQVIVPDRSWAPLGVRVTIYYFDE